MNKLVYLILLILPFYISISFAYHKCNRKTDIHCTYFMGDKSKNNGKYIKSTYNSISHIHCLSGGLSSVIPNVFGNNWGEGKKTFNYEQCLDAKCKESKRLTSETFIIIKNANNYTSNPLSFKVHMLNDYGQSCDASTHT